MSFETRRLRAEIEVLATYFSTIADRIASNAGADTECGVTVYPVPL